MTEQQADLIAVDLEIVGGQAHVPGTRIPASVVLDCLAAGLSEDGIIEQYPSLTWEGIRAAAAYGAALATVVDPASSTPTPRRSPAPSARLHR